MVKLKAVYHKYIVLALTIVIVVISAFSFYRIKSLERNLSIIQNNNSLNASLNTLTVESFNTKVKKQKNTIFVYIGNGECSDCYFFDPVLIKTLENKKLVNYIYYIDCQNLHKKKKEWQNFKTKYNFDQTPCLMIFKKGKRLSKLEWIPKKGISENKLISWLDKNSELIKESF